MLGIHLEVAWKENLLYFYKTKHYLTTSTSTSCFHFSIELKHRWTKKFCGYQSIIYSLFQEWRRPLQRIEAVITINKNRRAPHIVQIMPFNLISCPAVDSKQCAILRWAVRYPASRVRDYLGLSGLPVLTGTQLLSRSKNSVLVLPLGQDKKRDDVKQWHVQGLFNSTPLRESDKWNVSHFESSSTLQASRWFITNWSLVQLQITFRFSIVGHIIKCI